VSRAPQVVGNINGLDAIYLLLNTTSIRLLYDRVFKLGVGAATGDETIFLKEFINLRCKQIMFDEGTSRVEYNAHHDYTFF